MNMRLAIVRCFQSNCLRAAVNKLQITVTLPALIQQLVADCLLTLGFPYAWQSVWLCFPIRHRHLRTAPQARSTPDAHHRVENHRRPQHDAMQPQADPGESEESGG